MTKRQDETSMDKRVHGAPQPAGGTSTADGQDPRVVEPDDGRTPNTTQRASGNEQA